MLIRSKKKVRKEERDINEESQEEEKISTENRKILDLQDQVAILSQELTSAKKESDKNDDYAELLNSLYHKGIIDDKGNFLE